SLSSVKCLQRASPSAVCTWEGGPCELACDERGQTVARSRLSQPFPWFLGASGWLAVALSRGRHPEAATVSGFMNLGRYLASAGWDMHISFDVRSSALRFAGHSGPSLCRGFRPLPSNSC